MPSAHANAPTWESGADRSRRPLLIAHRGASALEPENSLRAFQRAAADGADGVELDVRLCATGEPVVFHDPDLLRLAGRPEKLARLPLAEIRGLRLASSAEIPTLEEALEACGAGLLVNIELKVDRVVDRDIAPLVKSVASAVERFGAGDRVLVSSFHPLAVRAWMRRVREVRAGLLFQQRAALPLRRAWGLRWLRPSAAHPEEVLCTEAAVRRLHAAGFLVVTWTVDDPARIAALRDLGVDGIITNDPAAARAALGGA